MGLGAHFLLLMLPSNLLLMMLPTHLLLVMLHLLIHRMLPVSSTSGATRLACVHLGLVPAHVSPVPLVSGLHLVSVCSGFSCFSVIGSRTGFLKVTVSYVPRFVSSFSSSRCCSLALTFG